MSLKQCLIQKLIIQVAHFVPDPQVSQLLQKAFPN